MSKNIAMLIQLAQQVQAAQVGGDEKSAVALVTWLEDGNLELLVPGLIGELKAIENRTILKSLKQNTYLVLPPSHPDHDRTLMQKGAMRASILPYIVTSAGLQLVLGIKHFKKRTDIGGGCKRTETMFFCAMRELQEETNGYVVAPKPSEITIILMGTAGMPWVTFLYNYSAYIKASPFIPTHELAYVQLFDAKTIWAERYLNDAGLAYLVKTVALTDLEKIVAS